MSEIDPGYRDPDTSRFFATMLDSLDYFNDAAYIRRARGILHRLLRPRPGSRIVDVGCGPGPDVAMLAPKVAPGGAVVGVDVSRRMLEEAARRWGNVPGAEFQQGRLESLSFPDASFDAAFAMRTLQYLDEPLTGVRELSRVTKPGGRIVLVEGGMSAVGLPDHPLARYAFAGRGTGPGGGPMLPSLLRRAGLARISVKPAFGFEFGAVDDRVLKYVEDMAAAAVDEGVSEAADARNWLDDLHARSEAGLWFAAECLFVVAGTVRRGVRRS